MVSQTVSHLLSAAMQVSPTSKEQAGFIHLVHAAERAGEDPVLPLLAAMLDGLRHGNWPTA